MYRKYDAAEDQVAVLVERRQRLARSAWNTKEILPLWGMMLMIAMMAESNDDGGGEQCGKRGAFISKNNTHIL